MDTASFFANKLNAADDDNAALRQRVEELGAELIERLNEIAEWREANRLLTAERDRLRGKIQAIRYFVNNPSAWGGFDQTASDAIALIVEDDLALEPPKPDERARK